MKAVMMNCFNIQSIDVPDNTQERIKTLNTLLNTRMLTSAGYPADGHIAYADGEALLSIQEGDGLIRTSFNPGWIAGNIIVIGMDENGDDRDCELSVLNVHGMLEGITFYTP